MTEAALVTFAGGACQAVSCGGKNPVAAMMAQALLTEMNSYSVAQAQTQEPKLQSIVSSLGLKNTGIQLG